jgi:hypothetical protein
MTLTTTTLREAADRLIAAADAHVVSIKGYAGTRLTDVAGDAEIQAPAVVMRYGVTRSCYPSSLAISV